MTTEEIISKLKQLIEIYPRLVGNTAVNFFRSNFDKQGWQGEHFEKWQPRKRENRRSLGKPILTDTGALKRSISVKSTTPIEVVVGTGGEIPYARIHNEGGTIKQAPRSDNFVRNRVKKGRGKGRFKRGTKPGQGFSFGERTITMPKRQFMGDSPVLRQQIKDMAIKEIKKALQS